MTSYIIAITSPTKLSIIINYLEEYPLFTSKFINYKDFCSCVNIILNREHLTTEDRD